MEFDKHTIRNHNHKDFSCDNCKEGFMIRDDSKLNVCFECKLFLCDGCCNKHKFGTDKRFNFTIFGMVPFSNKNEKEEYTENLYNATDGTYYCISNDDEILSIGSGLKIIVKDSDTCIVLK